MSHPFVKTRTRWCHWRDHSRLRLLDRTCFEHIWAATDLRDVLWLLLQGIRLIRTNEVQRLLLCRCEPVRRQEGVGLESHHRAVEGDSSRTTTVDQHESNESNTDNSTWTQRGCSPLSLCPSQGWQVPTDERETCSEGQKKSDERQRTKSEDKPEMEMNRSEWFHWSWTVLDLIVSAVWCSTCGYCRITTFLHAQHEVSSTNTKCVCVCLDRVNKTHTQTGFRHRGMTACGLTSAGRTNSQRRWISGVRGACGLTAARVIVASSADIITNEFASTVTAVEAVKEVHYQAHTVKRCQTLTWYSSWCIFSILKSVSVISLVEISVQIVFLHFCWQNGFEVFLEENRLEFGVVCCNLFFFFLSLDTNTFVLLNEGFPSAGWIYCGGQRGGSVQLSVTVHQV